MNNEIQWLVTLGLEKKLFSLHASLTAAQSLGEEAELVPFAEALLEERACTDYDALQELVLLAYEKAKTGGPTENPFEYSPGPPVQRLAETEKLELPEAMTQWSGLEKLEPGEAAAKFMSSLFQTIQDFGSSDLHITGGSRPYVRHNGSIQYLSNEPISASVASKLNLCLLSDAERKQFAEDKDLDFALTLGASQRIRANLMAHREGISGTYRLIPAKIPKLNELGFQNIEPIRKLLTYPNGLILVTGPICSGKSATLAAMIDDINSSREDHLIAIESPIEVIQKSKCCQISQREVGQHTRTFSAALKSALRQDPDIIVIGELRDLEAIEIAITASETGHLVIGTLHTNDAANTLNRVIDAFPPSQQTQIRVMLSHALRGIICQRLVPSTDKRMALAYELLLSNSAVRTLINENKPDGLANVMETGAAEGMQIMDKSILSLWESDRISDQVALSNLKSDIKREQLRELIRLQKPTHMVT